MVSLGIGERIVSCNVVFASSATCFSFSTNPSSAESSVPSALSSASFNFSPSTSLVIPCITTGSSIACKPFPAFRSARPDSISAILLVSLSISVPPRTVFLKSIKLSFINFIPESNLLNPAVQKTTTP